MSDEGIVKPIMECAACGHKLTKTDKQPYCAECWKEVLEEGE